MEKIWIKMLWENIEINNLTRFLIRGLQIGDQKAGPLDIMAHRHKMQREL